MEHEPDTLPIVRFARGIGKNTAEFTQKDLRNYLRWLWQTEPFKNKQWKPKMKKGYFGREYGKHA